MAKKRKTKNKKQQQQQQSSSSSDDDDDFFNNNNKNRRGGRHNNHNHNNHSKKGKKKTSMELQDEALRNSVEADGKLKIVDMLADGNCLFRALSDQLFGDYGNSHDQLRADICDYMQENEEDFKWFLVLDDDEGEEEEDAKDFEAYIEKMRDDGEWGGQHEILAAARLYQRKIMIFSSETVMTMEHGGSESSGADLMLSYHDNNHYNSVRDAKKPPNAWGAKAIARSNKGKKTKRPVVSQAMERGDSSTSEDVTMNAENNHKSSSNEATSASSSQQDNHGNDNEGGATDDDTAAAVAPTPTLPMSQLSVEDEEETEAAPPPPKLKKNDPCPCGSNKKYKKCCLEKERREKRLKEIMKEKQANGAGGNQADDTTTDDESVAEEAKVGNFRVLAL